MKPHERIFPKGGRCMSKAYFFLAELVRRCTSKMTTRWAAEPDGTEPCVFVCNHAGAFGPIDMCAKFPTRLRCHPWFNAQVMNEKEVPAYVRQDYWWKPGSFFAPVLNATLPYLAAIILPPILRTVPGVPVYHDNRVMTTMRQSLKLLKANEDLVIFPEQPSGYQSHHTWINTGFLNIATMYQRATDKGLLFYPVHVDYHSHEFRVAAPIRFDVTRTLADQQDELVAALAKGLRGQDDEE